MKSLLFIGLLLLTFFSFAQTPGTRVINIDTLTNSMANRILQKPFPAFVGTNKKEKINNDSLKGKVVLINFWFEGCHPCLAEFEALNELANKLKGNKEFEFISFTWDDAETIKRVQEKYKLQFKVFQVDTNECSRLNQNSGYPTSIILDRKGIMKYWVMGGDTDPVGARAFVMNTLLQKIQQEL